MYDNNVFFGVKEDGSRALSVKIDKAYHVEGRLEYADHSIVKNIVNCSIPLLRAGGDAEKIILSPLPRYMKPCCRDKQHITNRKEADYFANMGSAMRDIKDSIKDLVYGKKIRSFKVLEPMTLLEEEEGDLATATKLKGYFSEDPVHLSADGYCDMLQCMLNVIMEGSFTRPHSQTPRPVSGAGSVKDQSRLRQGWVNQDDTVAHRQYGNNKRPYRGRGGRGGHGGGFRGRGGWNRGGKKSWGNESRARPY
jgi:hypothetical protein